MLCKIILAVFMEPFDPDLKEILQEFSEYSKSYTICVKERKEQQTMIAMLKERLKMSLDCEENMRSKLKQKQDNIIQLQEIVKKFIRTKEENENLQKENKRLLELLDEEKSNFVKEKGKWNVEKDSMLKNNREEIENVKNIRNMEVSSLNREISHLKEENQQRIEYLKKEFERTEESYKRQISNTVANYEEELTKINRELISANTELKNLRNSSTNDYYSAYNIERKGTKERFIPQPISFTRYKPVLPMVSSASQMLSTIEPEKPLETLFSSRDSPVKKKKKLYTRTDDIL